MECLLSKEVEVLQKLKWSVATVTTTVDIARALLPLIHSPCAGLVDRVEHRVEDHLLQQQLQFPQVAEFDRVMLAVSALDIGALEFSPSVNFFVDGGLLRCMQQWSR